MERKRNGLYDSANEHDACGVGMVVNIHGNKSHQLVDSALKVLENMRHRGAEGADNKTGDGAGIMLQIPHEFILLQGIPVPEKGKYGTGLVFLPKGKKEQEDIVNSLKNVETSTEQPNVSETSKTTTQAEKSQTAEKPVQTKTEPKPAPKNEDGFDSVDLSEFS